MLAGLWHLLGEGWDTLTAPGLKKVASGLFVILQLVKQKKMCYRLQQNHQH